jgi:hypothetical protein
MITSFLTSALAFGARKLVRAFYKIPRLAEIWSAVIGRLVLIGEIYRNNLVAFGSFVIVTIFYYLPRR